MFLNCFLCLKNQPSYLKDNIYGFQIILKKWNLIWFLSCCLLQFLIIAIYISPSTINYFHFSFFLRLSYIELLRVALFSYKTLWLHRFNLVVRTQLQRDEVQYSQVMSKESYSQQIFEHRLKSLLSWKAFLSIFNPYYLTHLLFYLPSPLNSHFKNPSL